jgi:hypothetical protein
MVVSVIPISKQAADRLVRSISEIGTIISAAMRIMDDTPSSVDQSNDAGGRVIDVKLGGDVGVAYVPYFWVVSPPSEGRALA